MGPVSGNQMDQQHHHRNPLESSMFHSPPLGQSHPLILNQSEGGRWTQHNHLQNLSLGTAEHQASRVIHQTYTPPLLHSGIGTGMHPQSDYQPSLRQGAGTGDRVAQGHKTGDRIAQGHNTGDMVAQGHNTGCLLYTSPSPRDRTRSRMPSSA